MIDFKIEGIDKLTGLANDLRQALEFEVNLKGIEQDAAKVLSEQNRQEFETSTGPQGEPWPPRKSSGRTIVSSKPALVDTGLLRRSLENPQVSLFDNSRGLIARYVGEHAGLAKIHSEAKGTVEEGLPPRPVGGLSEESRDKIQRIAFARISEGFAKRLKGTRVR